MYPGLITNIFESFSAGPACAIRPVGGQRIIDINYSKDACCQWDFLSLQAAWITTAVPFLVMAEGNVQRVAEISNGREHIVGKLRVLSHDFPLIGGQRSALMQDPIWDAYFAYIMQERPAPNIEQFVAGDAHTNGDLFGQFCNTLSVTFRISVTQIECCRPTFKGAFICEAEVCVGALQVVKK